MSDDVLGRIPLIAGDGIGPEITDAAAAVFETAAAARGRRFGVEHLPGGLAAYGAHGTTLPPETLERLDQSRGAILGPVTTHALTPDDPGQRNVSAALRTRYELSANIRPVSSAFGAPEARAMDLVVVRENTQGFYADRNMHAGAGEFAPAPGTALAVRVITEEASLRVARAAFELAERRRGLGGSGTVTMVHKANVLRLSDGVFCEAVRAVAEDHPELRLDSMHVDAAAAELILRPEGFDVIVTTNMFGDILSNEAAALAGGLGFAPSLNLGHDRRFAIAQASHGSAPSLAGTGRANPTAMILSVAMLVEWLGREHEDHTAVMIAEDVRRHLSAHLARQENRIDCSSVVAGIRAAIEKDGNGRDSR